MLAAGWPETVPGVTINRACGSSQSSFDFAAGMVMAGQYDMVVAGGVESMTPGAAGLGTATPGRPYGPMARERYAPTDERRVPARFNQGVGAELIAARWGFSRRRLDEYASRSHALAAAAIDRGAFDDQIVPTMPAGDRVHRRRGPAPRHDPRHPREAQAVVHARTA